MSEADQAIFVGGVSLVVLVLLAVALSGGSISGLVPIANSAIVGIAFIAAIVILVGTVLGGR